MAIPNDPDTEYILSISYGKNSIMVPEACRLMGWRIDRVVHAEVWATDTIPADLPEMVSFKSYADNMLLDAYGLTVERFKSKKTYEECFYRVLSESAIKKRLAKEASGTASYHWKSENLHDIYGFPLRSFPWCNSELKISAIRASKRSNKKTVNIIGIAADEDARIVRHRAKDDVLLPLVEMNWSDKECLAKAKALSLLAPTYSHSCRGGCWFCHNQSVNQLRHLYQRHPELWKLLLKWDTDSPTTFRPDGHTVHDFNRRFEAEDAGLIIAGDPQFCWEQVDGNCQLKLFIP